MHRTLFSLFFLSILFLSACSEEESTPRHPELRAPVVQGLQLTYSDGNPLAIWGNPNNKTSGYVTSCNQEVDISAYPIPASDMIFIRIYSCNLPITVWVTPARLADNLQTGMANFGNGYFLKAGGQTIKILAYEQEEYDYIIHWDGTDNEGNLVPPDFYRIYVQIGDLLLWENVLLFRDNIDFLPPTLLEVL